MIQTKPPGQQWSVIQGFCRKCLRLTKTVFAVTSGITAFRRICYRLETRDV